MKKVTHPGISKGNNLQKNIKSGLTTIYTKIKSPDLVGTQGKKATNRNKLSLEFSPFKRERSYKQDNKKAFTLVELIVVITILAILGTIAFISLQGYSADSRDSVRISDLSNIDLQLELYLVKGTKLPVPDEAVTLESSGVIVGYQGYIGEGILNTIGVHGGGKDPLDDSNYIYRINGNKTTYQVMSFLENITELSSNVLPNTYATDLTKRYPITKGKTIGVLLEQTTNKPLQQIQTGVLDLRTNTTNVNMYLSTTTIIPGTPKTLYGTMETLALSQNFTAPKECPIGFIPVPGNRDLGQPSFCVAKYEMSFPGLIQTDNLGDWNTYSYLDNAGTKPPLGSIVSAQGNSPIAEITQPQAIAECKAMGEGYHLITNNEWMTIARNIEQQGGNWSSGIVGNGFIYNGISNNLTMGCAGNSSNNLPTASKRATITGHDICNQKNKLVLSNGEEIWDLSGNVWEHVNGANTLDGSNYNTMQAQSCGRTDDTWTRNSFYGNDGYSECNFSNGYSYSNIGPLTPNLNANNGIGKIRNYGGNIYNDRVFLRGDLAVNTSGAGVFALHLGWASSNQYRYVGFRCSF